MSSTLLEIPQKTMQHLSGSTHSLTLFIFLLCIITSKLFIHRLTLIVFAAFALILYSRRLSRIKAQIKKMSQGIINYPTLPDIVDSLQIFELFTIIISWYLFGYYFIHNINGISCADAIILSMMLSLNLFLMMLMLQQYWLSFFLTTCVSHGFFLFSILPRFIAGTRTILVSFIWYSSIQGFPFFSPILLHIIYIIFKLVFTAMWAYDFGKILLSKDFPEEFKTHVDLKGFSCPICCDTVTFYIILPCGHPLCMSCLSHWGSIHLNCPFCRREFSSWLHQVDFDYLLPLSLIIF